MKLGSLLSAICRHRSMKSSRMEGHASLSTTLVCLLYIKIQSFLLTVLFHLSYQCIHDGFYNFSDIYRPTNFALNISRGRALNTGPLRKVAQKHVKTSWHCTI